MSIQIRIFIGYVRTSELNMHLNQSVAWKEAKLLSTLAPTSTDSTLTIPSLAPPRGVLQLQETDWAGKKYVAS